MRPGWPLWQALCAVAGVVGTVLSVDHPARGADRRRGGARRFRRPRARPPAARRARATQDVVARAREPRAVTLVVLAAVDRPRTTVLRRVPAALEWLQGALTLDRGARRGARGRRGRDPDRRRPARPGGGRAGRGRRPLDATVAPVAEADAAAADAAVATARDAPWAEVVFVGAGELGLRARLRAERRAPEATVLCGSSPRRRPGGAPPTRRSPRSRARRAPRAAAARALPAGERPALALGGPARPAHRPRAARSSRGSTPASSATVGQLDEVVERGRVGQRVAAGRLLGRRAHQDPLDRAARAPCPTACAAPRRSGGPRWARGAASSPRGCAAGSRRRVVVQRRRPRAARRTAASSRRRPRAGRRPRARRRRRRRRSTAR